MVTFEGPEETADVLILFRQEGLTNIEPVLKGIEEMHGRILHAYPPYLLIAHLPQSAIAAIRRFPQVQSVDTEEDKQERLETLPEAARLALAAWNAHLQKKHLTDPNQNLIGLSWDSAGRLPPDPPPHLREALRRREQEEDKDNSGSS